MIFDYSRNGIPGFNGFIAGDRVIGYWQMAIGYFSLFSAGDTEMILALDPNRL